MSVSQYVLEVDSGREGKKHLAALGYWTHVSIVPALLYDAVTSELSYLTLDQWEGAQAQSVCVEFPNQWYTAVGHPESEAEL